MKEASESLISIGATVNNPEECLVGCMDNMNNLENPSNRNITPITQIEENGSNGYRDEDWSRMDHSKAD
jgi:hypothetical protein